MISSSALKYRKCLISAKIGSELRIAGSIDTNDNFFLVKNVTKERCFHWTALWHAFNFYFEFKFFIKVHGFSWTKMLLFWVHLGSGRCWADIGVGWISYGLKIFRKSTRKQIMLTKNALEHAKRILARPGLKWTQRLRSKMWTRLLNDPTSTVWHG